MAVGLVGRKCGMTRVFTADGVTVPVTVIEVLPNRVTQVKAEDKDGYAALQVTFGHKPASKVNKALAGHYAKAHSEAGQGLWEFCLADGAGCEYKVGDELTVGLFQAGQSVDVQGTSRGKGFMGTVRRHNFRTQDATHGNSLSHRVPGSIGQRQTPGRVFKGKKMAGHMGNATCTVLSQEIFRIDSDRNLLLIKGAVPGAPRSIVTIVSAVKAKNKVARGV